MSLVIEALKMDIYIFCSSHSLMFHKIHALCREKARLKKLTLKISERQEEEELNEAVAHLQRFLLFFT